MLTRPTSEVEGMMQQQLNCSECEKTIEDEMCSKGIDKWPKNLWQSSSTFSMKGDKSKLTNLLQRHAKEIFTQVNSQVIFYGSSLRSMLDKILEILLKDC